MVQLSLAPVINEKLFSKHFLEERIKGVSEWQEEEKAKIAYEKIKGIYDEKKGVIVTYTDNEAQLEMDFIRPVLKTLGHIFGVQATVQQSARRPDYAFFEKEEDKTKAFKNKDSDDFYRTAIAVGDAKAWDKDLDKKVGGKDIFENQNPSYQIDFYLRETHPDWGILTNGRKWRLYFEEVSHRLDTYYEVDLVNILEKNDFESFKYFYLFFRREAFIPVGDSFLDKIYNQSVRFAEEIGENLEDSVYKSLLWMAKGYFDMKTNRLEKTEEKIKEVHENSLIFLYRLLFLLYVESKGMLGTEVPQKYAREYCFTKWVEDILNDIDNDRVNPKGGLYNHRLFSIFRLVREGSEALGIPREEFYIPAYNGGLFDNEKHPFLRDKKIQDGHIAEVVDLLVRVPSKEHEGRGRIDYSDLSLRHLGGIYEGLLEYKLKLADQEMVAVKEKGTIKWIPSSEADKDFSEFDEDKRVEQGELFLVTDRGERKATGSYYTPDYIVKYIVENTVGPVVEEKLKEAKTEEEKIDAILSMKVLDPAMGSGHFLVETVDFLASKLAKITKAKGEEKERDIDWAKRKVARNCVYGVDVNPLATELAKVSLWLNTMAEDKPLSFLDHHLKTGNSLIGADIHELDKHPEGAQKGPKKVEKAGQLTLSDFFGKSVRDDIKQLLGVYKKMLKVTEERPEDIKEQEELFQKFEAHPFKKRFDVLSDVKTSYHFGNKFTKKQYERLLEAFRSGPNSDEWNEILQVEWVRKASDSVPKELKLEENLSDQKRFFHWELEFPEVFFDIQLGKEKKNPGFDIIVGNPPYINIQNLRANDPQQVNFFDEVYSTSTGKYDIYVLFVELAHQLIDEEGSFSYIMSNKFFTADYGKGLRKYVTENRLLREVNDFGNQQVFERASTYTGIFIYRDDNSANFRYKKIKDEQLKEGLYATEAKKAVYDTLSPKHWIFCSKREREVLKKIEKNARKTLQDISKRIFQGINSGADSVFVLTPLEEKESKMLVSSAETGENHWVEKELLYPILKGKDIRRYYLRKPENVVLYLYTAEQYGSTDRRPLDEEKLKNEYPLTWEYLNSPKAKKRLQSRKYLMEAIEKGNMGYSKWYEMWKPRRLAWMRSSKLLTQVLAKRTSFALDEEGKLFFVGGGTAGGNGVIIEDNTFYILGVLNSRVTTFYLKKRAIPYRGDYFSFGKNVLKGLPILETSKKDEKIAQIAEVITRTRNKIATEKQSFLKWISREWKCDIEDLSLKTRLKEYWNYGFDEMLRIAKKNKSKIDGTLSSRKFQEKLEKEWMASVNELNALMNGIQDLENQLDALVFRQYKLVEDEVEVVLESLETEDEVKQDILEKFRSVG
jgi:hypothetical protein